MLNQSINSTAQTNVEWLLLYGGCFATVMWHRCGMVCDVVSVVQRLRAWISPSSAHSTATAAWICNQLLWFCICRLNNAL